MSVHVNRGPGPVVERARTDDGVRWCFSCRKRLPHTWVVYQYDCDPLDDWYGPWGELECAGCGCDRTVFPGCEGEADW